jgi:hypothetical protein
MKSFIIILAIALASTVAHAAHYWHDWKNDCSSHRRGYRTHTAKLWGAPVDHSWIEECVKHGANIGGKWYGKPTFCVKDKENVYGEFDVPDSSCLPPEAWTNWNNFCAKNKRGYRTHTAIMEDVPAEVACRSGANIKHHDSDHWTFVSKPTRCLRVQNNKLQVEYDILSSKC